MTAPCRCTLDNVCVGCKVAPSAFRDVLRFHRLCRLQVGALDEPAILTGEAWARRVRLILEELAEVAEAHAARDMPEFADGLVDLVWVVLGTAVEAGVPFDACWAEVRRANMDKAGGKLDASGKLLKPPGWRAPDIAAVLQAARPPVGPSMSEEAEWGAMTPTQRAEWLALEQGAMP